MIPRAPPWATTARPYRPLAFVAEVKRIRGKKNPLSVAALKSLRDEHARTIEPARAQAAEALTLER